MQDLQSIKQFQEQGTLRLFLLSLLTLGVYSAHYIKRQTFRINRLVEKEKRISEVFVYLILIFSYGALITWVGSFFFEEGHPVEFLGNWLSFFLTIMVILWTFSAGARLNEYYEIASGDIISFDYCWMFLFGEFYFNYNINGICKYLLGQDLDPSLEAE